MFVLAQKQNLLNGNHLFVWYNKFGTGTIYKSIFGLAQKIWTSPKHFKTCRRKRQSDCTYTALCSKYHLGFLVTLRVLDSWGLTQIIEFLP